MWSHLYVESNKKKREREKEKGCRDVPCPSFAFPSEFHIQLVNLYKIPIGILSGIVVNT